MFRYRLAFLSVFICSVSFAQKKTDYKPSDVSTVSPVPYDFKTQKQYKHYTYSSFYLTMRDGNKIAVEVYLPKGIKEGEKIPAIMHQTRYWRSFQLNWPFNWMTRKNMIEPLYSFMMQFVRSGYAVVNVDTRGSGASFGTIPHPWTKDEVQDGYEIADWIVKQPWSSGKIGASGASYSGTTSEFLLTTKHPAVKAVVNLFSLFDVYEDNAFPGGVHNRWFTSVWGYANSELDKGKIPTSNKRIKAIVKGVKPVQGKGHNKLLKQAIASHAGNLNVNDGAKTISYRDDVAKIGGVASDQFSPHTFMKDEDASGAAVYSYSGWSDGAYQHSAIKRHLNLTNPANKLILGPWEHGGRFNTSPANPGETGFDHLGEIMKFFDYHLKGVQNGIDKEPRIHYFTMGEEQWKSSDVWPPRAETTTLFLGGNKMLMARKDLRNKSEIKSIREYEYETYQVDTTVGTGPDSRWRSVAGQLHTPKVYPDRNRRDSLLLVYNSIELSSDVEVSGHVIADLFISSNEPDACLFVYLEDVDQNGNVHYVTEGLFRAIHRKVSEETPPYKDVVPYHTYLKKDAQPLIPDQVAELKFDLLPVSYLFKKGHKIRIAISGADADHFRPMTNSEPKIKVWHTEQYPSRVELPVVENK
ncbi:MAG: putative serine esterase [Bacteroidia bacterium]|nr:putative serine esterase [Bacteroidia bacterium]